MTLSGMIAIPRCIDKEREVVNKICIWRKIEDVYHFKLDESGQKWQFEIHRCCPLGKTQIKIFMSTTSTNQENRTNLLCEVHDFCDLSPILQVNVTDDKNGTYYANFKSKTQVIVYSLHTTKHLTENRKDS